MQAKGGEAESKILDPGFAAEAEGFSPEYRQLLTEGKDLKTEIVARTEEWAEASEQTEEKCNHGTGFIAQGPFRRPR